MNPEIENPETAEVYPERTADVGNIPYVGGAVLVSHFDRHHVVHTVMAHVLAIAGGTHLATPDGAPALTVAFPDPEADPIVLQGPNWARGYKRVTGVVHHSHPEAHTGHHSIVWGHALDQKELEDEALLDGPKHSADNPVFQRHQPEANIAEIPQGFHGAPRLRSEDENAQQQNIDPTGNVVEPAQYGVGSYPSELAAQQQADGFRSEEDAYAATGRGVAPIQPVAANVDHVQIADATLLHDPARIPRAPETAQDSAIDAAEENAHNAAVAAEQANMQAADAAANADQVNRS